jgi:hypothetical protein
MEKGKPKGRMVSFKKRAWDVLFNYSQTSTIAGFHYIFEPKLSVIGKVFWFVLVVMLTAFGAYFSIQNYGQWTSEPVIITLKSTGLPVSKVDFPSGVNFINVLWARFSYKISNPKASFAVFGAKILYKKCVCKTLMKLTPGINFINVLRAAFLCQDSKSTKDTDYLTVF